MLSSTPIRHFTVTAAGCGTFIVHARKAWLRGLSPKQNRQLPPLRYEQVHRLKHEFPELTIVINGGLRSPCIASEQVPAVDGVMIGREAYGNPWSLTSFEAALLGPLPARTSRHDIVAAMTEYAAARANARVPTRAIWRHMLGLFNGVPGARAWRRRLAMAGPDEGPSVLTDGLRLVAVEKDGAREAA